MARKRDEGFEDRQQRIIDGALEVFARKGFQEATNRDIADSAGLGSPGLLYHYFKDKADLFKQVIEQRIPMLQLTSHPEELARLAPEEGLLRIGSTFLQVLDSPARISMMKLVLSESARRPAVARLFNELGPSRVLPFVARFLEGQMEAGRLRRTYPVLAARSFMGPLLLFVITRVILQQPEALAMQPDHVVAFTVETFLRGMRPEDG